MILGTSKTWSKSGPGALRIITKMLQKIQKKYGIILDKYYCCQSGTQTNRKFSKSVCPRYQIVSILFSNFIFDCLSDFLVICWIYILKIILRRWGMGNATFSITKQHTDLDMHFISIKKHEQEITLNFLIFKDATLHFSIFRDGSLNFFIFK